MDADVVNFFDYCPRKLTTPPADGSGAEIIKLPVVYVARDGDTTTVIFPETAERKR